MQSCLLSAAIMSALALSSVAVAGQPTRSAPAVRAQTMVHSGAVRALRRDAADRFVTQGVVASNGEKHVRMSRTFRGLPVIGGDVVLHMRNGSVSSVTQTLATTQRPTTIPSIKARQALSTADKLFDARSRRPPSARLVIYARGETPPVLAYQVRYTGIKSDQTPTDMRYIVNAHTGEVLDQWDTVQTARPGRDRRSCDTAADGTGIGLFVGQVDLGTAQCRRGYQLTDPTRGGGRTTNMANRSFGLGVPFKDSDNVWGSGTNSNSQTVGVDGHYGTSTTWDYYLDVHGRVGIADDGEGALTRVHFGRNYANAFWSDACFCMTFGDGNGTSVKPLVQLDIAGHEMSHGVTSRTAGLIYSGESGGLNEATSDIFGTMVEFYADNAADSPDYLLGELVFRQDPNTPYTTALRYMFKPSLDAALGGAVSADCYSPDVGNMDVHYSSGVANHFFYLLAEGAVVPEGFGAGSGADLTPSDLVCNGDTSLAGIGHQAAEQIWYLALTGYMVSDTDYAGARAATLSAATDLYGAESAEYDAVAAAWSAVSVE